MAEITLAGTEPITHAALHYIVDTGVKPVNESYGPGPGGLMRRVSGSYARHVVPIRDARRDPGDLGLETSGFALVEHTTRVADFFDTAQLASVYYPEMEALVAVHSGARRVHVFDHTLRSGDESTRATLQIREPVRAVHNDYTEWSGPQRVRDLMGAEAEDLLRRRFAIIQVWRAIRDPIARDPLAIADARSLAPAHFVAAERRFPDRVGEIYQFTFDPAHRWHYFPRMRRDEALVFKVYDSSRDGRARWGAHTSFEDPATPSGADPRESIEIRAFAFF
jgi:hypothetical protein